MTAQPSPWVSVSERLPPENQAVLVLLANPTVAIDAHPTVARLDHLFRGTQNERLEWWAGVPGNWMPIRMPRTSDGWGPDVCGGAADGWIVTHWTRLPEIEDFHRPTRAGAWARWLT